MKINFLCFTLLGLFQAFVTNAQQENRVLKLFPQGTVLHGNVPFNDDTLQKHLLDIYLPANIQGKIPLVVLIHGGGWIGNDKTADIGYVGNTVSAFDKRPALPLLT